MPKSFSTFSRVFIGTFRLKRKWTRLCKRSAEWQKQIEPGCEIIVPSKAKKKGNIANILGYATSFSSLGMMIASIANLIKK